MVQSTGALLWTITLVWVILFPDEIGVGAMILLLSGVLLGSLLLAIPEILRYHLALQATPPLTHKMEQALRDFHAAWMELSEKTREMETRLEELEDRYEEKPRPSVNDDTASPSADYDILLSELKLELDALQRKWEPLLGDPEEGKGRELPPNLLGKALKNSGQGKGFPLQGKS